MTESASAPQDAGATYEVAKQDEILKKIYCFIHSFMYGLFVEISYFRSR